MRLRCSSLPLAFKCPGSVHAEGLRIDPVHEAAGDGTAAHEALQPLVETGRVDWAAIPDIAANHGADEKQVRILVSQGVRLWEQLEDRYPNAVSEVPLSMEVAPGVTLAGTVDILSCGLSENRVADWKTGRVDGDYREQLLGYAALTLDDTAGPGDEGDAVTASVLWVRDGDVEHYTMARDQLPAWRDRLVSEVVQWDGTYRPGRHCDHCPVAECPARAAMVKRDVAAINGTGALDLEAMTPAERFELREQAAAVEQLAKRVKDEMAAFVKAGGEVANDTHELYVKEQPKKRLRTIEAFGVLTEVGFTDADFGACVEVGRTKVNEVAKSKAPRGKGAAAIRTIENQLKAAGAIETRTELRVEKRRRP